MNRTLALTAAAALAAAGLVPGTASAATRARTLCLQITDPSGDGAPLANTAPGTPSYDSLDIVSADLATGKKNLVAVIRLKGWAASPLQTGGRKYQFKWTLKDGDYSLAYLEAVGGEKYAELRTPANGSTPKSVKAVVDPAAATVTFTIARKELAFLKKPGTSFGGLRVDAYAALNIGTSGSSATGADYAEAAKPYKDLTPTCVKGT